MKNQDKNEEKNRPIKKYRFGGVSLSMWENKTEEGTNTSATIQKSYKNSQDQWEVTTVFYPKDLIYLRAVLDQAIRDYGVRAENVE